MGNLFVLFVFLLFSSLSNLSAAVLTCTPSAVTPTLHAEGLAERLGDIVLTCSGGTPGPLTGNLSVFLNVNITNKLTPQNFADAILTLDAGSGAVSAGVSPVIVNPNQISFNGVNFTVPATGNVSLRLSNLRGAVNQLPPGSTVRGNISFNGSGLGLTSNTLNLGISQPSLFSSVLVGTIASTAGSPVPENPTFTSLLAAGTRFSSARFTEGTPDSFQPRGPLSDNGIRILARYSNLPAGIRLFVPDAIAGSDAVTPTAGGDFGVPASGGQYAPGGNGSLLLVRVNGTDANGAGGNLVFTPGPGTSTFDSVSELAVAGGSAQAVYELVDANPALRESAQFPAFMGLASSIDARSITTREQILLGPVSTVATASASAPIPRFAATVSASDCNIVGDCNGAFLPRLGVDPEPLSYTLDMGAGFQIRYVRIFNAGGNVLVWNVTTAYKNGSGWLRVFPVSGLNDARIRVDFLPDNLPPGSYDATLTIDAGAQAGTVVLPVHAKINPAPPAPKPAPVITSVVNAASFVRGPLVRGSFGTAKGSNLSGQTTLVSFDGVAATVVFTSATQVNFIVPNQLTPRSTAQLVLTVDGVASAAQTVELAEVAPGIFNPGILNQDNSVNSVSSPALIGSVIQIFTTGLLPPEGGVVVDVKVHDAANLMPLFAGPAPGIPGLQQVNVRVPLGLPGISTEVVVCGSAGGTRVCSPPAPITLRQ